MIFGSPANHPILGWVRHSRMLLAGIQAESGLDPRLKHSGVTLLGVVSQPSRNFQSRNGLPAAPTGPVAIVLAFFAAACLLALEPTVALAGHDDEYIETVPAERVKKLLEGGEKILLVDLRPAGDFQKARLPGAISIPISELQKRHQEIPKSGRVILYCACPPGGVDESYSYLALRGKGYRNVSVLEDGFSGWAQRKFPVVSR
jgi:rhodanese-related sulfurtransferase